MELDKPFAEFGASLDPKQVPWHDAVVWSERTGPGGARVYEWLAKEHIRSASWTSGTVSIQISSSSFLFRDMMYVLIQAPFVSIGSNVPVA